MPALQMYVHANGVARIVSLQTTDGGNFHGRQGLYLAAYNKYLG